MHHFAGQRAPFARSMCTIPAGVFTYQEVWSATKAEVEALILQGYKYFAAGGARGFDTIAAKVVVELKQAYPDIHLVLVLPFQNQYLQEKTWSDEEISDYQELQRQASTVVVLSEGYCRGIYHNGGWNYFET